jgi:hypothetical protein
MLIGKGFRWTGAHTQTLETALFADKALPVAHDPRGGFPALHAIGRQEETDVVVPWAAWDTHAMVTMTTGGGKTRLLEVLASAAIRQPRGAVFVLDPKLDRGWAMRCEAEARQAGKPFHFLVPAFHARSARMNVLATARTPAEVRQRIEALMPPSKEPIFREYPLAILSAVAAAQQTVGQPWTLEGLYRAATFPHELGRLTFAYLTTLGLTMPPRRTHRQWQALYQATGIADNVADVLLEALTHDRQHFIALTSNLLPTFEGVVGEPYGKLFSAIPADLTWERIADEGMVVYVALSSLLLGETAHKIGRLLLQDLLGYIGFRQTYTNLETVPPVTVLVDEVGRVAYPGFPTALAMSRSAKVRFVCAEQSQADLEATLERQALARQIQDNCGVQVWGRMASSVAAQEVVDGLDTCIVQLPEPSQGVGYGGVGGLTGHATQRLASHQVPVVRLGWLTGLPTGHAYVQAQGQLWKIRIPLLTPIDPHGLTTADLHDALPTGNHPALPPAPPPALPTPPLLLPPGSSPTE